jgi:HK97 family phage prohead protease
VEIKAIGLELKDVNTSKRTAIIAHAVYNNIDRTGDISCKGMFEKTWRENKNIDFLFNHEAEQVVGNVLKTFEDEEKAYTEVKFGNWTLGNDVLEMADSNVLKGASFGYIAEKKEYVNIKGRKIRKLKEVYHGETSLLTKTPANALAGIISLQKSFAEIKSLSISEQQALKNIVTADQSALEELIRIASSTDTKSDLYSWVSYALSRRADLMGDIRSQLKYNSAELKELTDHVKTLDKFCRNTKASDDTIKKLLEEKESIEQFLSEYNTANTQKNAFEPSASIGGKELLTALKQFNQGLKN